MKKFFIYWLPVVLYAAVIFYLSSLPNVSPNLGGLWDIIVTDAAHFVEYFILSILFYRAMLHTSSLNEAYKKGVSAISCILYAVSDEIHQSFIPTRTASVGDLLIDAVGIILGIYFFCKFFLNKRKA
jgi:VanZ family protein